MSEAHGELDGRQTFALAIELESAIKLTDLGVTEIHNLSLANDYFHLPMQLLSQGLERFLKLTYSMAVLGDTGSLPSSGQIRRLGHDLLAATEGAVALVEGVDAYASGPAVVEDLAFIRGDGDLRSLLMMLADFGRQGRYYALDEFLDPSSVDVEADPRNAWQALEMAITQRQEAWAERIADPAGARTLQAETTTHLAGRVDRFARAIARMWTLGALPAKARTFTGQLRPFLSLRDELLGVRRS